MDSRKIEMHFRSFAPYFKLAGLHLAVSGFRLQSDIVPLSLAGKQNEFENIGHREQKRTSISGSGKISTRAH